MLVDDLANELIAPTKANIIEQIPSILAHFVHVVVLYDDSKSPHDPVDIIFGAAIYAARMRVQCVHDTLDSSQRHSDFASLKYPLHSLGVNFSFIVSFEDEMDGFQDRHGFRSG